MLMLGFVFELLIMTSYIFGLMRKNDYRTHSLLWQHANNFPLSKILIVFDSYSKTRDPLISDSIHNPYIDNNFLMPRNLLLESKNTICMSVSKYCNILPSLLRQEADRYKPLWYFLMLIYIRNELDADYAVITDDDIAAIAPIQEIQNLVRAKVPFFIPETGAGLYENSIVHLVENLLGRTIYLPRVTKPGCKGVNGGFCGIDLKPFEFSPYEFELILKTISEEQTWSKWQTLLVLLCFSTSEKLMDCKIPLVLNSSQYMFMPLSDPSCFVSSKIVHCVASSNKRPMDHIWSEMNSQLNSKRHKIVINYLRSSLVDAILELGVDDGATARMMLLNTSLDDPYYLGIDLFDDTYVELYKDKYTEKEGGDVFDRLQRSLKMYSANARLVKHDSSTFLAELAPSKHPPFGICFIDGDHSYDGVRKDFWASLPHMKHGSSIFIDDYTESPEIPGVRKFVDELRLKFTVIIHSDLVDTYRGHIFKVAEVIVS